MDTMGQLVFYVPFFLMTTLAIYYTKWTKRKFSVLLTLLPVAYFSHKIFSASALGTHPKITVT